MANQLATAYVHLIPSLKGAKSQIANELKGIDTSASGLSMGNGLINGMKTRLSAGSAMITGAIAGVVSQATSAMMASMSAGIERADLINNFPKVMSNFNIPAEESTKAVNKLSESLRGLPTGLDTAVSGVQRLVSKNGDISTSTDMWLAMNNAILAGGASMAIQQSASEQLTQSYAKGKMDMMEWRTLQMAMPGQLKQVAEAMGLTTEQLGAGLRDVDTDVNYLRTVTMDEFMGVVTRLNTEGVGGFQSFAEQAKNATGGVQTSMTNVGNAMSRAWQNIINAIGADEIKNAASGISSGVDAMGKTVSGVITELKPHLQSLVGYFTEDMSRAVPIVGSVAGAFAGLKVVSPMLTSISGGIQAFSAGATGAAKSSASMSSALGESVFWFRTAREDGKGLATSLGAAATGFKETTAGAKLLSGVTSALRGGLIMVGTALAGMMIAEAIENFQKLKEREENLKKISEELVPPLKKVGETQVEVAKQVEDSIPSYEDMRNAVDESIKKHIEFKEKVQETYDEITADAGLLDEYVSTIEKLAGKANLTAEEQAILTNALKAYNDMTGDTVQATDIVNGQLDASIDKIKAQADAWKNNAIAQAEAEIYKNAYVEKQTLLTRLEGETAAVEAQRQKVNDLSEAYNDHGAQLDAYAGGATPFLDELIREQEALSNLEAIADDTTTVIANLDKQMADSTQRMTNSTMELDKSITPMKETLNKVAESSDKLNDVNLDGFSTALSLAGVSSNILATKSDEDIKKVADAWNNGGDQLGEAATKLAAEMGLFPGEMANAVAAGVPEVMAAFEALKAQGIEDPVSEIPGLLGMSVENGLQVMTDKINSRPKDVAEAVEKLKSVGIEKPFSTIPGLAAMATNDAIDTMAKTYETKAAVIADAAQKGIVDSAATQLNKLPDRFGALGDDSIGSFNTSLSSADGTDKAATSLMDTAESGIDGESLKDVGDKKAKEFTDALNSPTALSAANSNATDMANSAKSGLESVDASGAGNDFASGYINTLGSQSNIQSAMNAAAALARAALQGIKNEQQSQSPAKATRKEAKNFVDGYYLDIVAGESKLKKAGEGLSKAALSGLTNEATFDITANTSGFDGQTSNSVGVMLSAETAQDSVSTDLLEKILTSLDRLTEITVKFLPLAAQNGDVILNNKVVGEIHKGLARSLT